MQTAQTLKRSLGMWAIVGLGLGYMTPVVVFDTFGTVAAETSGAVPAAYLAALVVMLFTALSYGKMVRVFPGAGSAYTYTSETMHPNLGFMVGWAALLDYLLLPMVNAVIIRSYMMSFFPEVPAWIWVVTYVSGITAINVYGMRTTSRVNAVLVVFQVVLIGVFLVLTGVQVAQGLGEGTIVTIDPLVHPGVQAAAVLSGATVVAFSFIGFDAVTMYTEEAVDPKTVPRAILLTVLIGGGIFFAGGWFAQTAFPTVHRFTDIANSTLPQLALFIGGTMFKIFFVAAAFAGAVASSLASHASVSRMLYVMGRNGTLVPQRLFAYIHPRYRTPVFTVVVVGAVSMLAVAGDLALVASVINFGALIAFTFVNLSVIAHYVVRQRRYKTARDLGTYVVLPLIGAGLTGLLWYFLDANALVAGLTWCGVGFAYLLLLTRGFRKPVAALDAEAEEEGEPEPVS